MNAPAVTKTAGVSRLAPTTPTHGGVSKVSLLPAAGDVLIDPMALLHSLTVKQREAEVHDRTTSIEQTKKARAEAFKAYENALAEAKRAREKKSFFGDLCKALKRVGTALAAVGAAASIIATGGASLPAVLAIASVAMSTLATVNQELGIIRGELGETLNTWLVVGSAVCGVAAAGAGLLNIGASAAGTGASGASTAGKAAKVAGYVGKGAKLGAAVTNGASAAAGGAAAVYKHEEEHRLADGEEAAARMRKLSRREQQLIEETRAIVDSYQRSIDVLLSTMGEAQRTQMALVSYAAIRG